MSFMNNSSDKYVKDFKYPALSNTAMLEWQATLGSVRYPSWGALKTLPEFFWNLEQAITSHQSVYHAHAIELDSWTQNSFIIGMNLQKVHSEDENSTFSGTSSKMGDLLTFVARNVSTSVDQAWVTLAYDSLITISEDGVAEFS